MTIETDVAVTARHFGIDAKLIQSVVNAEGNIIAAVRASIPSVVTRQEALEVTCRSAVHAMSDFIKSNSHTQADFVITWAARWAPVGAENDPTSLNQFWPKNVLKFWTSGAPTV